jgi:predicted nucleic acid-binding protein
VILVDTTVWIDLFAGLSLPHIVALESLIEQGEDLCICGVILTEVLQGIRDDAQYAKSESILSDLLFLPMTRDTFLLAASIYRTLRARGITIRNSVDCMIAAVCIENEIALLHNDRDFEFIAQHFGLRLVPAPSRGI